MALMRRLALFFVPLIVKPQSQIRTHLGELVRGSVDETLNELLNLRRICR